MRKFIFLIIILAILVGITGLYYYQKNIYSKEILKLEIFGPEKATIYQEIEYLVKYKNNGNTRLEEPELIFEYPKYSLSIGFESQRVILGPDKLGEAIYPGEERQLYFKARLIGREGEGKIAKASLSYRPKNLKARYESTTSFTAIISSVPLTFEFDLPSKAESGRELKFRLNYFSNLDYPLSNLRIKIEYPSNFEFLESNPRALEKTEWERALLNKAEGGRIEISGKLFGEVGEQKIFRAELGIWQEGEFILLKEAVRGVEIVKPSLYILQQINGNPQYIASPGDLLYYEIFFKNIGEKALNNLFLIVNLEGKAFDFETIKAPLGKFEPGSNSIVFDWRRVPKLQFLDAREEGKVEFWIELKEEWEMAGPQDKNPVIKNKIYLSQAREEFITKVNSKLVIEQKGYFQDEVFGNSGPIPPKVGETTTYTIMWQVKNYYNDVKNVKIKATLLEQVKLTGKIFPEDTKLTYDSQSREIVWEVGDLEAGKGILPGSTSGGGPNIAFQIAFSPNASQKGQTPELIGQAKISGEDTWTEAMIESVAKAIDTTLPDDSTISEQQGIVQ